MIFWNTNEPFAISALIIALGYVLKTFRVLDERDGEALAKVALNVTLPAIILLSIPAVPLEGSNLVLPVIPVMGAVITAGIAVKAFRKQEPRDLGLSMTASVGYNIGLFAIPLVSGLYGAEGIARFAMIDIGNAFVIFGFSNFLAAKYTAENRFKKLDLYSVALMFLKSVPFVTYLVALGLNFSGIRIIGFLGRVLEVPAAMNRGVSLLALGVLLRFKLAPGTWKAILPTLTLRYAFGVAAGAAVLLWLPMPLETRVIIAGVLVMPVGLAVIPYAVRWGYDRDRAAAILNVGIPISFLLFWTVYIIGGRLAL